MANPWDSDPIVQPAQSAGQDAPWANDPIAGQAAEPPPLQEPPQDMSMGEALSEGAGNLGKSFMSNVGNMANAVLHPIRTAEDVARVGVGEYDLMAGNKTHHADMAHAVNQFYKDRYGSYEGFKRAVATDPFGVTMDIGSLLVDPAASMARAGTTAAKVGEVARLATNPVYATTRAASGLTKIAGPKIGHFASEVGGIPTGAGGEPIRVAYGAEKDPATAAAFDRAVSGQDTAADTVADARAGVDRIAQEASNNYANDMANNVPDVPLPGFVPAAQRVFQKMRDKFGPDPRSGAVIDPEAYGVVGEFGKEFSDWYNGLLGRGNGVTVHAADVIKKKLDNLSKGYDGARANYAAQGIVKALRDIIRTSSPEYAKVMDDWGGTQDLIRELQNTLSTKDTATIDTAIRKLHSTMRDQVNTGFGARKDLIDVLDNYSPGLKGRIAGQSLKSGVPRGVARLGPIGALFGALHGGFSGAALGAAAGAGSELLLSSPRVWGKGARLLGKMAPRTYKYLGKPLDIFANSPLATRAAGITGQIDEAARSPFETQ